jgi:transposase
MGKKCDLTSRQVVAILTLQKEGCSQREIAQKINCSQSAVCKAITKSKENKGPEGIRIYKKRNNKTKETDDKYLKRIVKRNPLCSLREITNNWNDSLKSEVSHMTVHRRLKKLNFESKKELKNHF